MRIKISLLVACLAVIGVAVLTAKAPPELVIDDFTASPYKKRLWNHLTYLTDYQTGPNIRGGVRQTNFSAAPVEPYVGQSTLLEIRPDGHLVVSGGYKSHFALMLGYGYDTAGGANRLNLDLSGGPGSECPDCDRFRINFDGSDAETVYLVQVFDRDGDVGTFVGAESLAGRTTAFHLDAPFAEFGQSSDHPIDWEHIDFIVVLLQTGAALGGHDFDVTRITAIPEPE